MSSPSAERVTRDVSDLTLTAPDGAPVPLRTLHGVQIVVLMRHRH